jgi:hypothetical protein
LLGAWASKSGGAPGWRFGATNLMLKAAGGWSQDQEVATYTADADQARLAADHHHPRL